jgi:hypothetical protein
MHQNIVPPDADGDEDKDSREFRRNLVRQRHAITVEDYVRLGYTEAGAQAMVEQAAGGGDETPVDERKRKRAKQLAANPALINAYLLGDHPDAVYPGGKAAAKERRAANVRALHYLWRRWRAEANAAEAAARICVEAQREEAPAYVPLADGSLHHPLPSPDEAAAIEVAIQQRREHWVDTLGAPPLFDRLLRVFFERAGRIIFASPDPATAMRDFFAGVPVRGRRKDNVARDRKITAAVLNRVDAGEKLTAAIKAVADASRRPSLSHQAVRTIYDDCREEALAVRALRGLWNSE